MAQKDPFQEFIEKEMGEVNFLSTGRRETKVAEMVDEAIIKWIHQTYGGEFPEFDFQMRDLIVQVVKKSLEIAIEYPEIVYFDAMLARQWESNEKMMAAEALSKGEALNLGNVAFFSMRSAFIMGMAYGEMCIPILKTHPRDSPGSQ